MCCGAPELERSFGRDWFDVSDTSDTIGAEEFSVVAHAINSNAADTIRKP